MPVAEPRTDPCPRALGGYAAHRPAVCLPGGSWVWSAETLNTFSPVGQRGCSQRRLPGLAPEGCGEVQPAGQRQQLPLEVALLLTGVAWPSCSCLSLRRDLSFQ